MLEEYYLIDQIINKMTGNQTINTGLQTIATLFGAGAVTLFTTHFWYAVVCALVSVGCYVLYEILP